MPPGKANGLGDDQLFALFVVAALIDKELGCNPDDSPARGPRCVGDGLHQTDRVAAVDQLPVFPGDRAPQRGAGVVVVRRKRLTGRAIDSDGGNAHGVHHPIPAA
jgi:hypothetical protein